MAAPATFYTAAGDGVDTYWRSEVPARVIGAKRLMIDSPALTRPSRFAWPGQFHYFNRDGTCVYPHHEGAAVWTRPCLYRAGHASAMSEQGVRILAEVDDNYISQPKLNLFMRQNKYGPEARLHHLQALMVFDGVVFSTQWLRDRYATAFRKEIRHVPDLYVARNHTLLADWPVVEKADGPLRVGWMGSAQHHRDIKLIGKAFYTAQQAGCRTVLMGHDVRDTAGVTSKRAAEETSIWGDLIDQHVPWVDPALYHRTPIPFDIGLVPLELNDHTLGKSDIKNIEYAMSGAAIVCQAHPVYTREWKHNETCLVASSADEFARCVWELARSRRLRERLVGAARAYVAEERSDEAARKEWETAIG